MSNSKKVPSKNQQIMDGIKASIAADKLKIKKEPSSKISSAPCKIREPKQFADARVCVKPPTARFFSSSVKVIAGKADFASSSPSNLKNLPMLFDKKVFIQDAKKFPVSQVQKQICDVRQIDLNVKSELLADRKRYDEEIDELKTSYEIQRKQLADENDSLKFDLELKSEKIAEMRKQIHLLQEAVVSNAHNQAEIQKLSHRNVNLSSDLSHQRIVTKSIAKQLEGAQKKSLVLKSANDVLLKEIEVLRYRLGDYNSPASFLYRTANQSPICTPSESRPDSSSFYRSSVTPPRTGKRSKNSSASFTFLNTLKNEGRKRHLKTPTKIYAPEGVTEVRDVSLQGPRVSRRIDLNDVQDDASPDIERHKTEQTHL